MTPRRFLLSLTVASLVFLNGCRHNCCKRNNCNNPPPPGTVGVPPNIPPQNLPLDPPPGARASGSPEILLPDNSRPNTSGYAPMVTAPIVVLGDPEPALPQAKVVEEEIPAPRNPAEQPPKAAVGETPAPKAPPKAAVEETQDIFPAGIAEFATVKEGVNSGLRPHLVGWNWLESKKYRAVLYLKGPNENDSSDREQAQKHGLKFYSLTVSPDSLNADLFDQFKQIVNNADDHPIFVYDQKGIQAGAMWYLYFRKIESLDDDLARIRAARHGLKTTGTDEQVALWTAVQKFLAATP